ncbi:hypothetical protein SDC9_200319 [bioreactor metagenome]|uniref:Stage III sporulation protein AD n=1 Tax=bioreactor metagenome TaxID=1076179 RepID=A0A645IN19_9ZZZZ
MIFKIGAMAIIAASLAALVRSYRPELGIQIGIAAGLLILLTAIGEITGLITVIEDMASSYGLDASFLGVIFKVIGIAYVAQFAAQACRDSGEGAIAGKVELAARVVMLALALPTVISLLDDISGMISMQTP